VISLIPPMSTFAMLMRLTSVAPPPAWQIALSMVLSLGAVVAAVWFASKVFRVGLLMFGKPPDFATLIRWVRMA
jgi:ABC-2 type transport system permease protein